MNREDLELYVIGAFDGDVAALERELAEDEAAREIVADEARLELVLREAAAAATFCPACNDLVRGARCDACGAAIRPGGYTVERVLVSNAHGRMYAARDVDGKQVALKELAFVQSPAPDAVAAFERESKVLRALEHPAIPKFCASFQEGVGVHARYYLAQELVAGEALDHRLVGHWFTEAEILGIARQVLDVLVYLQGLSPMVIHRDIKPANLLLGPDGKIAVVDFGAAHVQGMTIGTTTIGTFGYMPIEQLVGDVDATTDVYALGASLIHLLTRREPCQILQGGLLADAELNVSRAVRALLAKLVAPNPRDRFRSATEARAACERLMQPRRGWLPRLGGKRAANDAANDATNDATRDAVGGAPAARPPVAAMAAIGAARAAAATNAAGRAGAVPVPLKRRSRVRRFGMLALAALVGLPLVGGLSVQRHRMRQRKELASELRDQADALRRRIEHRASRFNGEPRELAELADAMCRCTDQLCVETVTEQVTDWSRDVEPSAIWIRPDAAAEVRAQTERMNACLTRVVAGTMQRDAGRRSRSTDMVELPLDGGGVAPIHDAAFAIALTCNLSVVVPGSISQGMAGAPREVRCDRAFDALDGLLRAAGVGWETDDAGIVRLGERGELVLERAARRDRQRRGITRDALPPGRDVSLSFRQVPLRNVVATLTQTAGLMPVFDNAVGGTVTVKMSDVRSDRALIAILDANGFGYRYDAATHELRIAPRDELDAERTTGPAHSAPAERDPSPDPKPEPRH